MKISDQIRGLEATRAAKVARLEALTAKSVEEGRSLDEAEAEEFDTVETEISTIDSDLTRMKKLEGFLAQGARTVHDAAATDEPVRRGANDRGSDSNRGPTIIVASRDADDKFKGQSYTRRIIARALAQIEGRMPSAVAQERWGKTNPTLVAVIKANEVASGGELTGSWGAELVQADTRYTGDFIEYLHSKTVFDQLPLRSVPANVAIKGQDGTATGYWVGEGKAVPATTADFSSVSLTPLKVGALAVITNELIRDSSPAAEGLVQEALARASGQRIDATFISTAAAVSNVSPAGILNGVTGTGTAGDDEADVRTDLKALLNGFITAKNATGLYMVMNPALAMSIGLMTNALGQDAYPGMGMNGGTLRGIPVVTGDNVNAAWAVMLKPSDIYRIGDTGVQVSMSQQATIEQSTAPTGAALTPTAASADLISMFQSEATAIKIVRSINFAKRRAGAVAYIYNATYGAGVTSA